MQEKLTYFHDHQHWFITANYEPVDSTDSPLYIHCYTAPPDADEVEKHFEFIQETNECHGYGMSLEELQKCLAFLSYHQLELYEMANALRKREKQKFHTYWSSIPIKERLHIRFMQFKSTLKKRLSRE